MWKHEQSLSHLIKCYNLVSGMFVFPLEIPLQPTTRCHLKPEPSLPEKLYSYVKHHPERFILLGQTK